MIRSRGLTSGWLAVGYLIALACGGAANQVPAMGDTEITVLRNAPTEMRILATDGDIDPTAPGAHPLRFILLDGPIHGALLGDLEHVSYGPSHDAWLDLTYVPASGYIGGDSFTWVAVDPLGAASSIATVRVDVVVERRGGSLAGTWDAEFTFNVQSAEITAFSQRLVEAYRIGNATLKVTANFAMESPGDGREIVFDALRFEGDALVGDVSVDARLAFDPQGGPLGWFDYFLTGVEAQLFGVSVNHALYLTTPQTESYQVLSLHGSVGGLDLANSLRLELDDDCSFLFARDDFWVTWSWCGTRFRAGASFVASGFEDFTFSASGIEVPRISWLPTGITVDAALTFAAASKTVTVSVNWAPLRETCIYVLGKLGTGGATDTTIEDVALYGLILDCRISEGVRLRSATSFDPAKNAAVTGQIDYFESLVVSGDLESCCGIPGLWSVATYFRSGAGQLFDWGMTLLKADVAISDQFSLRLVAAFRSGELGDPISEFTVGWTVRW